MALQINGRTYFKPSEIAQQGLIVNTKGKSDYKFVLRLINSGKLPSIIINSSEKLQYKAVAEDDVNQYNDNLTSSTGGQ